MLNLLKGRCWGFLHLGRNVKSFLSMFLFHIFILHDLKLDVSAKESSYINGNCWLNFLITYVLIHLTGRYYKRVSLKHFTFDLVV